MGLANLTTTPGNHHRSRNHVHICFFFLLQGQQVQCLSTLQQREQETRRRPRFLSLVEKERDCSLLWLMNAGPPGAVNGGKAFFLSLSPAARLATMTSFPRIHSRISKTNPSFRRRQSNDTREVQAHALPQTNPVWKCY
jgi:hypothetical protein